MTKKSYKKNYIEILNIAKNDSIKTKPSQGLLPS